MIVREFSIASGARVSYEFRLEFGECSDCDRVKPDATEQIVGPERRLHVLHHHWFGER
jgi:hypothetical protein